MLRSSYCSSAWRRLCSYSRRSAPPRAVPRAGFVGPLSFQPAELMKLTYILYLAAWLSNAKLKRATDFQSGLAAVRDHLRHHGGTPHPPAGHEHGRDFARRGPRRLFCERRAVEIYSGHHRRCGAPAIVLLVFITPYRMARITGFLHPTQNLQGQNYQVNQSLIAIGSGGLWGVGIRPVGHER